ncbi:MAG TPA: hypothetical protein VN031_03630 [Candidatus Microsaccharimonas sp.]|nr:hypothetical protein [Candidatus Microsaccharimonas sp.]
MPKLAQRHEGFSVIEGLLVLVIIALIAGIAVYVMKARNNSNASLNAATQASPAATKQVAKTSPAKSTPIAELTADSATAQVQKVYDGLLASWTTQSETSYIKAHPGWFTANFLNNSVNGGTHEAGNSMFLLCGNGPTKPDKFEADNGVLAADKQTATVEANMLYGSDVSPGALVHVQAKDGTWLIDSRSCATE